MSWDTDFYSAAMGGSYTGTLAKQYRSDATTVYSVYSLVTAPRLMTLNGVTRQGVARVQVDTWADSPTEAEAEALKIADAIASNLELQEVYERELTRDDTDSFGYSIDYLVWFDNP